MKQIKRVPAYVLAAIFFLAGTARAQISFGVSNNGTNTYVIDTRGQGAFIVRLAAIPAASGVTTCTVQIDGSSDNVNFGSGDVLIGVGCTNRGGFISGIAGANWIRLNITQTGTGNVQFNVNVEKATSLSTAGLAAANSAVSGNPLLMAGSDGSFIRTIRTDANGAPFVGGWDSGVSGDSAVGVSLSNTSGSQVSPLMLNGVAINGGGNPNVRAMRTPVVFKPFSVATCATETTIWTPTASTKFRLMGMQINLSASDIALRDNTAGTIIFRGGNAGGTIAPPNMGNGILSATANNVLTIQSTAAATCIGTVWGTEE